LEVNHAETLKAISQGKYTDEIVDVLTKAAATISERFK
jgi:hypothetical protein